MKQYQFVDFEKKELLLTISLEKGLGRSLTPREALSIKWHSECDYETSGILLDLFEEIREHSIKNVMGVDEAALTWNLSAGYIKNLCSQGKIKARKIGKTWIIDAWQPNPSKSSK